MTVPGFKRSWQFMVNQIGDAPFAASGEATRGQNGDLLIALKNCILGTYSADDWLTAQGTVIPIGAVNTGWSCDGSSDGAGAFGNGDGVDRWANYDDVIFANPGTNHSWFTFKNPTFGTNFTLVFDCRQTNNSITGLDVVVMPTGYTSNGTATARPSAVNERTILALGTSWGSTNNYVYPTGKWHFMADAGGKHFRWMVTRGMGYLVKMFDLEIPDVVPNSTWTDPWVSLFRGVGAVYPTTVDGDLRSSQMWLNAYWLSRISGNDCTFYTALDTATGQFLYDPSLTSVNAITGKRPVGGLGLQSPTAATFGYQANVVDMWMTQSSFNQASPSLLLMDGSSFPDDYSFQVVKAGDLVVPWPMDVSPDFGGGY